MSITKNAQQIYKTLAAAVVMAIVLLSSTGAAKAATISYVWDNRKTVGVVPLEYLKSDFGNPYYWMTEGTRFQMRCYGWGKGITGNYYSTKWFYGQEFSRGSWGWVHSSYVYNQASVGAC